MIDDQYRMIVVVLLFREFRQLVGMKDGFFFERIFSMFDKNSDGQIVFVRCIAFLTSRASPEDRLHCRFTLLC